MVRKWLQYSGGALGLGILSVWLFRHSSYAASDDLNRWTKEAVGGAAGFWEEHVQEPVYCYDLSRANSICFFICFLLTLDSCCGLAQLMVWITALFFINGGSLGFSIW